MLLLWVTGQYVPVSVPSATLSPEAVTLRRPHCTFGMRGPSAEQVCQVFVAVGHLIREIIATSGSYIWGNGANTCGVSVPSATLSPEAVTLRRRIALLACVAYRPNKSAKFRRCGSLLREIIATSGSYYGVRGQYVPVSVPSATLSPEAVTLRRRIALLACVAHRAEQVCQVSSLWVTYSER
ncbi:hypothetical protein DPMN_032036 [Dreissena polymorpha]|uniref:Uncharacterized protein n=1 Tax=Dreissena polymorpha TaxID=45954 RepID=A0A9D4M109_DREPO|nr:hypothetical protein DPMN_032036 [Dreissena polymorpha]